MKQNKTKTKTKVQNTLHLEKVHTHTYTLIGAQHVSGKIHDKFSPREGNREAGIRRRLIEYHIILLSIFDCCTMYMDYPIRMISDIFKK